MRAAGLNRTATPPIGKLSRTAMARKDMPRSDEPIRAATKVADTEKRDTLPPSNRSTSAWMALTRISESA